ncbi:MAG: ATP-binding cassette domain-containing protein [Muribaculaceae bacterium]|nr:ATP-binding cassette domain-containing protein [Muribaculaceae bacterium]
MINEITLKQVLPCVFKGMEDTERIRTSQIWEVPSFVFNKGCKICIQAESGCGKSSLLSFIFGNRSDYSGQILFDGKDVRRFSVERWCDIRTRNIALLPQEMRLFPELTVMQNISIKNDKTGFKTEAEIMGFLERLGIADKRDALVGKLSIGQQQRVGVIRTLCQPYDFIFLDEPVSHLDETNNRIVSEIVEEEAGRQSAGIISTSVGNHLLLTSPQFVSL